ncbi:MAG: hypothetical protein ACFFAZ_14705 [Promethearchaeota archaeon]
MSVAFLVMAFIVTLTAAAPVSACRHRVIRGHMDLFFVNTASEPGDPGYPISSLTWDGKISGGIKGRMLFWNTLLEFDVPNVGWAHFTEIWQILHHRTGEVLLQGVDEGYVTPEGRYFMSGEVTIASHQYGRYIGHGVFMFGVIDWVVPLQEGTAPGTFLLF